ncbi:MAG: hypothetical protein RL095_1024 [Verrucomicrobiota bacterium]|jgi:uncharacterized protein YqeY
MSIEAQIAQDLKAAMIAKDQFRLAAVREIKGAIIKLSTLGTGAPGDEDILKAIKTLIKEKNETLEHARKAERAEMIAEEEAKLKVLQSYLPAALSEAELKAIVAAAVANTGAKTQKEMGLVMKAAREAIAATGKDSDGKTLSELIKAALS